jgi:ankyrin repeat protein
MQDVALARELLQHGADPNARDGQGRSPLHIVVPENHVEMAKVRGGAGGKPRVGGREGH